MRSLALFAALAVLLEVAAAVNNPSARYVNVVAYPNQEIVITLLPYDPSGTITSVSITQMPTMGLLYQTSLNFELYGYNPTRTVQITAAPTTVTSPTYRVVYVPPPNFVATTFKYSITGASGTRTGQVTLTAPDLVTVSSPFWTDNEGWTIQSAVNTNSTWSPTSTSASLNYFVFGGDFDPVVGLNNNVRWYFLAPSKFLGNFGYLYNGFIQFWLGSFAGDFSANSALQTPYNLIELWCSSCDNNKGVTLAQRYVPYNGGLQFFNFTLNEYSTSGWFQDPKNGLVTVWPSPSQCTFINVLMGLTSVRIYGDVTTSFEVVGLDSFTYVVGPSDGVNLTCYL